MNALSTLKQKVQEAHNPELINDAMVYQLFSDGELTLTKGAELFGKRKTHQMIPPLNVNTKVQQALNEVMPLEQAGYKYIFIRTREEAIEIQRLIIKAEEAV